MLCRRLGFVVVVVVSLSAAAEAPTRAVFIEREEGGAS